VLLVGHSYGGAVISNVAADAGEITGLVYIAAFAPDTGESANVLAQKFPRRHARRRAAPGCAQRRYDRSLGALPLAVLRRRPGAGGGAHGGHATAGDAGGPERGDR
jgi:pimeloyl-ACP methyl ester carboxylesterase